LKNKITKTSVSVANAKFWDELCGSQLAKYLGIKDSSLESLKKFDDWYFDFYPYLDKHILFNNMNGQDVLEIGLGYGSVSQRLAMAGANYKGLDIAQGPVNMVNHRLKQNRLNGKAIQGSILEPPFKKASFDTIIAIGCLHHTGDLQRAIDECYRLLRPEGCLIFMVYYAYSYRRWTQSPIHTIKYLFSELFGIRDVVGTSTTRDRSSYDKNNSGEGAPHTDWISKKSLSTFCRKFSETSLCLENIDTIPPLRHMTRKQLLNTIMPKYLGLDLYVKAIK